MNRLYSSKTALLAVLLLGVSAPALAQTVVLDNLSFPAKDKTTVNIKHVEATGTNLSKDELTKLFTPDAPEADKLAIVSKMKADKLSVPEVVVSNEGSTITLRDLQADNINAGKFDRVTMAGGDGSIVSKDTLGPILLKSGALEIKGGNLSTMLKAAINGNFADGNMQMSSINWSGFEVDFQDKDTPVNATGGNVFKITAASLVGQTTYDGAVPLKGAAKVDHIVIMPPPASQAGKAMASFGYDKVDIGITAAGSYDKNKKTYSVDDYTITAANAGSFGVKALVGAIDPSIFTADQKAKLAGMMSAEIADLSITYVDNGLFGKSLAFMAAQQKKNAASLKTEWAAMATQFIPVILGGDPASLQLAAAVSGFINNPKSLTIDAKAKGAPLKVSEIATIRDPKTALSKIDLTATSGK